MRGKGHGLSRKQPFGISFETSPVLCFLWIGWCFNSDVLSWIITLVLLDRPNDCWFKKTKKNKKHHCMSKMSVTDGKSQIGLKVFSELSYMCTTVKLQSQRAEKMKSPLDSIKSIQLQHHASASKYFIFENGMKTDSSCLKNWPLRDQLCHVLCCLGGRRIFISQVSTYTCGHLS